MSKSNFPSKEEKLHHIETDKLYNVISEGIDAMDINLKSVISLFGSPHTSVGELIGGITELVDTANKFRTDTMLGMVEVYANRKE